MRVLALLLALIFLAGAAASLGLVAAAALHGLDVMAPAGELWFKIDSGSLNAAQAAVERYLLPALWHAVVLPLLRLPAILLVVGGLVLALVLFALARRRGNGKRRIFHR
ncbi:hypothetical protein SAMN05216241_101110 [Limimonas halophila]|uniref:Uncharacterized protein n=1 Tax=Limimonas halophila TaxID=1082479 RepID=A0A1G7L4I8_9PROT|nr:hypothetical protein [Limimonas halophila]SDF44301.1 hypothetical protein SAMN05216241_101110 [Limimonas halophila]